MAEKVKTFVLCSNQRKLLARMTDTQKAALIDSLFAYNDGEDVKIDDPLVDTVFAVIVETIERMRKFNEQKKLNGMNGGRPPKNSNKEQNDETKNNQGETKNNQDKPSETSISMLMSEPNGFLKTSNDVLSETDDSDAPGVPPCPQKKLLDVYHETLPELAHIRTLRGPAQKETRERWREKYAEGKFTTTEEGIEYFRGLFEYVRGCPRLMGKNNIGWRCDFRWIMKADHFDKITEGNYEDRQ
jgi:hypothetical protein